MKKIRSTFAALFAVAMLFTVGCVSTNVAQKGKDMVVVENSGLFLFYLIPIATGDPDYPNQQVCRWFENTMTVKNNIRMVDEEADRLGASGYRNLVTQPDEEILFSLLLKRKIFRTSAELLPGANLVK